MANYVAAANDFDAPFDAMQNAILPFAHTSLYVAMPNTSSNIKTTTVKATKKSPEPALARIPRAPTALTPEQESAVISSFLVLADQERLQRSSASANYESTPSSEHKSTEMGRSHSIFHASDNIHRNSKNKLPDDIARRITFSPIIPRKRNPPFASYERPTKKQRVSNDYNEEIIKNKSNNQVAASDTFKTPALLAEDLHTNKRGTIQTAMERAFQRMPPFHHPTNTTGDIVKTVNSKHLSVENSPFATFLDNDERNNQSDDGDGTSKKRAFDSLSTYLCAPEIDEERAKTVTANNIDDHRKKRKFSSECTLEWTPEQVNLPPGTNLTELPTTSAELYEVFFPTSPGNVIPFFRHHINAVIRGGALVLPGTPPGTNSRRTRGTSFPAHDDGNASTNGDATNSPAPTDEIGPMSERDPTAENAVNPNFNDDISDNGLDVVNMSATTSIYSQYSQNSRNRVHLYSPVLTRAFDTTHTSTADGTRTKPMTEIFIKNIQDEESEFPTTNSPPSPPFTDTTHADTTNHTTDMLTTTIPAQTQTKSAFRHPATKNYAATDTRIKKTTRFSVPHHQFSNGKPAAPTSCNPFYFLPISGKAHKLHPALIDVMPDPELSCHLKRLDLILSCCYPFCLLPSL
jgi:hypothetical protein